MKRYRTMILCATIAMFVVFHLAADTATVNGITWTYTISNGEASLGGDSSSSPAVPNSTAGALALPSTLGGCPVTSIGRYAFHYCSGLTSVTIPDSVTSIGDYAFCDCGGLTNVVIGSGVTSIGSSAFNGCKGLTSVTIPDSVTSIGDYAFNNCGGLTNVVIGSGVTSIGSSAFNGCKGLTSVTIPDSVTSIGSSAFSLCRSLSSVIIPDSVTSIGLSAFSRCGDITSVVIPSRWAVSALFTDSYATITSVTVPYGSDRVADEAFKGCSALTSISIPDSVTSIGDEAFCNCASLQQLTIPDGVTSYGVNCFEGCPAYTLPLYRAIFNGNSGGGSPVVVTTVVQNVGAPYTLSNQAADRAIASVTVNGDCSIDSFVLKDDKVYDSMLYVSNTADREVVLSLPSGYSYKTIKGATPLTIPASSQCLISITRVDANVFLVMREELDDVK